MYEETELSLAMTSALKIMIASGDWLNHSNAVKMELKPKGLFPKRTPQDGNCMSMSICKQIERTLEIISSRELWLVITLRNTMNL